MCNMIFITVVTKLSNIELANWCPVFEINLKEGGFARNVLSKRT